MYEYKYFSKINALFSEKIAYMIVIASLFSKFTIVIGKSLNMSALEAYVNKRHFSKNRFFTFLQCLPLPLPSKNLV